jgi:hypothetical protein
VWACYDGTGYGEFHDIDKITMFADYRVPQILNSMGCLYYSPKLVSMIARRQTVESGSYLELQLRGALSSFFLPDTFSRPRANGTCSLQQGVASGASR